MSDSFPTQPEPSALDRAVAALRHGRADQAEAILAALDVDTLPPAHQGPALGMHAQALFLLGRLQDAKPVLRAAMRTAKSRGDLPGLEALRGLNAQLYAQLQEEAEQTRLAAEEAGRLAIPLEQLLAQATTPQEACTAVIAKANALAGAGDPGAVGLALEGWERADKLPQSFVRERVLARLCQAKANPAQAEAYLNAARDLADKNSEPQLLAAVVQAAKAQAVVFAPKGAGL